MVRYIATLLYLSLCINACSAADSQVSNQEAQVRQSDAGLGAPDTAVPLPGNPIDSALNQMDASIRPTPDMTLMVSDISVPPECENECVSAPISWGRIGGRPPFEVSYAIEACRTQVVWIDTPFASDPSAHRCERTISDCQTPDGLEFEGIRQLIAQIKAQGLCRAALVYGIDSRPWDGQVFSIRYENEECILGDPCDGVQPDCTEPPEVLLEAADLLWSFGREMEQNNPACARIADGL